MKHNKYDERYSVYIYVASKHDVFVETATSRIHFTALFQFSILNFDTTSTVTPNMVLSCPYE